MSAAWNGRQRPLQRFFCSSSDASSVTLVTLVPKLYLGTATFSDDQARSSAGALRIAAGPFPCPYATGLFPCSAPDLDSGWIRPVEWEESSPAGFCSHRRQDRTHRTGHRKSRSAAG